MSAQGKLLFASHNQGKVDEVADILRPLGIEVLSAKELGISEPDETESTFIGNARIKAMAAHKATGFSVLADDSGLCVDALDGAPGVYTADWAETGSGRNFNIAMERVETRLQELGDNTPRGAQFCATMVFISKDGLEKIYQGVLSGRLTWPPRGRTGHGYDPVFVPENYEETFGEMDPEQKNEISHRRIALDLFMKDAKSGDITF